VNSEEFEAGPPPQGDERSDRPAGQPDDPNARRPRRRGRRGRGGGAQPAFRGPVQPGVRPPQPFRGPPRPQPFARPAREGPPLPRPAREEDEASLQARELAAYERRQQQQQRRSTGGWRPATQWRPAAAGQRRPFGGAPTPRYEEQIRRATGGTTRGAAPSHDAGEPIAGPHSVLEAIRAGRVIRKLYVSQDRSLRTGAVNELIAEAQQRRIFVNFVEKLELSRLSPIENHQGVVAIVEGRAGVELDELLLHLDALNDPALVLVVDSLQDPQNFGVLLRSAEGTGVDGVVIPRHRSVGLTAAVAKTSAGASEHLLVADVANLRQAIDALKEKGVWVVGTDQSGDALYDEIDYRGDTAIVVGGEGEGIRRLVLEGCDQVVRIPMEGRIASLNAAAAGTVVLYEALRQRRRDAAPPGTRTPRPEPIRSAETESDEADADDEVVNTTAEDAPDELVASERVDAVDEALGPAEPAAAARRPEPAATERETEAPDEDLVLEDHASETEAEDAGTPEAAPTPRAKPRKTAAKKTTTKVASVKKTTAKKGAKKAAGD